MDDRPNDGIYNYWRGRWDRASSKQEVFSALLFHYCSVSQAGGIAGSNHPAPRPEGISPELRASRPAADGYVMVPREPTERMCVAIVSAFWSKRNEHDLVAAAEIYRAALAAAGK